MKSFFLLAVALLYFSKVNGVAVQNVGPGTVVFLEHEKVQGHLFTFRNETHIPMVVIYRESIQAVLLNSFSNDAWQDRVHPSQFRIGSEVQKITGVVEVTEKGYNVYINGQHHFFPHRLPINTVTSIISYRGAPKEPSVGKVLKHFSIGRVIYIKATAPSSGDFKIELLPTLPRELDCQWSKVDLVLHAKFSASPPAVTRNTYGLTCGGAQLGESDGGMPFTAGEPFELIIVAQQFGFEIGVNGAHFASYAYRNPLPRHITVMLSNVPAIQNIEYY